MTKNILPQQQKKVNEMNISSSSNIDDVLANGKRKAEEYINAIESDETKFMSEKQLRRCLMLKQMKLCDLQITKLQNEHTDVTLSDSAVIDLIGWNMTEANCVDEEPAKCESEGLEN